MASGSDPNEIRLTGENPIMLLRPDGSEDETTRASFWRILLSPAGPGHVLFLRSELTEDETMIFSDNIALTRWLQREIVTRRPDFADESIPVIPSTNEKDGDLRSFWTERVSSSEHDISLTWYDLQEPFMVHSEPGEVANRVHGIYSLFIPARSAQLEMNGMVASGKPYEREQYGRQSSSAFLAFSETWVRPR